MSVNPSAVAVLTASDLRAAVAIMAQHLGLTHNLKGGSLPNPITLTGADGRLTLAASGKGLELTRSFPCDAEGRVTVKLADLKLAIGACSGPVSLTLNQRGRLILTDASGVVAVSETDPLMATAKTDNETSYTVDGRAFADGFRRIIYAVADENGRYGLNGVSVEVSPTGNRVVGSDGSRLAYAEIATDTPVRLPTKMLLHGSAVRAMLALPVSERLTFRVSGRAATLIGDLWSVRSRLVEADYPDYRQVVPATYLGAIIGDRDALMRAFRRVASVVRDRYKTVRVATDKGALSLTSDAREGIRASMVIPVGLEGVIEIKTFNGLMVGQALESLPPGPVRWEAGPVLGVTRLTSLTTPDVVAIVMPVRVD